MSLRPSGLALLRLSYAAKSAGDAVLGYRTALEVHGKAHSVFERYFFQSNKPLRPSTFRSCRFQCVLFPKALREKGQQPFATKIVERAGLDIRVADGQRGMSGSLASGSWSTSFRCSPLLCIGDSPNSPRTAFPRSCRPWPYARPWACRIAGKAECDPSDQPDPPDLF